MTAYDSTLDPAFAWVETADGSLTLHDPVTGEHYHNLAGAYAEALQQYILPSGLLDKVGKQESPTSPQCVTVLDACFGLGYNSYALLNEVYKLKAHALKDLELILIEMEPPVLQKAAELLRLSIMRDIPEDLSVGIQRLLQTSAEAGVACSEAIDTGRNQVTVSCYPSDLRQAVQQIKTSVDAIFHDPFSPKTMPELWSVDIFKQYYRLTQPVSGSVYTYSAASAVRAGLQEAGFTVYKSKGLGARADGTVACVETLNVDQLAAKQLSELGSDELLLLHSRAGIPYRDTQLSGNRDEILQTRKQEQQDSERPSSSQARRQISNPSFSFGGCASRE